MQRLAVQKEEIQRTKKVIGVPAARKGGFSPRWVTQLLQNTMMPYFISYIKKEDRHQAALTMVLFIREHLVPMLYARAPHELRLAHETRNIVLSALFRTERRGNHYREDYPMRDDGNWLAWTKIHAGVRTIACTKVPVPEAWRPNSGLSYMQKYPYRFPGEPVSQDRMEARRWPFNRWSAPRRRSP